MCVCVCLLLQYLIQSCVFIGVCLLLRVCLLLSYLLQSCSRVVRRFAGRKMNVSRFPAVTGYAFEKLYVVV
jgi:hypothetical protein